MPDKPKRRKNNKNKRKNKNHRPDPNKSNSVTDLRSENGSDCIEDEVSVIDLKETENENGSSSTISTIVQGQNTENEIVSNKNEASSNIVEKNKDKVIDESKVSNEQIVNDAITQNIKETVNSIEIAEPYVVESPENTLKCKVKLDNNLKSKSLDNDDDPKITELSNESAVQSEDESNLSVIEGSNVLVTDADSDIEWEKVDEIQNTNLTLLKTQAGPSVPVEIEALDLIKCEKTSLTPEAEQSLRNYLKTLNLSTQPTETGSIEIKTEIEQIINREIKYRLRKKGLADDFLCITRTGPNRILDVIDEEGSGDSSVASRRLSHLSDKKSDVEDLDDDVFEDDSKLKEKYSTKAIPTLSTVRQIPQKCILVGAKLKEPEKIEARGDWSVQTMEMMTGAEVVYLTDTSSSASSINDLGDETDDGVDTDASVRIITPTIEVTDTESLLKKSFAPEIQKAPCQSNVDGLEHERFDELNGDLNKNNNNSLREHEIEILSTDNIKTNLYVKDIESDQKSETNDGTDFTKNMQKGSDNYDLEMKVIKCQLNQAISNLINEVASDTETANNPKESYVRQDSSSSVSSQCTTKYNPTYSSLNDVSNMHDDTSEDQKVNIETKHVAGHVKDVFECVAGATSYDNIRTGIQEPPGLRDLCVRKIATLPYGEKILEELASVSKRLQNITIFRNDNQTLEGDQNIETDMPYYPLPDLSTIETVSLEKSKKAAPPPIKPRNSSFKKIQDENWTALPTKTEPVYVCLSPSQKMLMEKTNTVITKEDASELIDMHKKYVDRRGYCEARKIERENNNPPVIPFKSQTGSRLLALIRDPSVTNNINSSLSRHHQSLDHIEKSYSRVEKMSKRIQDQFNTINDYSLFKPIPPPRPKKYSSTFYESDESSDFTDSSFRSMKSERKMFHYSTGTLNKEIENDISTIQNMHRHCTNIRDQYKPSEVGPRRPSLPKDLCDQQMEYIKQKEKEVEAEIQRLEQLKLNARPEKTGPRAPLISEKETLEEKSDNNNYSKVHKKDFTYSSHNQEKGDKNKLSSVYNSSHEEIRRDKMYSEYVSQMALRQERKEQKMIKITNYPVSKSAVSTSMPILDDLDSKVNNRIEKEFICKARERWEKLGIKDPETEDERETGKDVYKEPKVIDHKN